MLTFKSVSDHIRIHPLKSYLWRSSCCVANSFLAILESINVHGHILKAGVKKKGEQKILNINKKDRNTSNVELPSSCCLNYFYKKIKYTAK